MQDMFCILLKMRQMTNDLWPLSSWHDFWQKKWDIGHLKGHETNETRVTVHVLISLTHDRCWNDVWHFVKFSRFDLKPFSGKVRKKPHKFICQNICPMADFLLFPFNILFPLYSLLPSPPDIIPHPNHILWQTSSTAPPSPSSLCSTGNCFLLSRLLAYLARLAVWHYQPTYLIICHSFLSSFSLPKISGLYALSLDILVCLAAWHPRPAWLAVWHPWSAYLLSYLLSPSVLLPEISRLPACFLSCHLCLSCCLTTLAFLSFC